MPEFITIRLMSTRLHPALLLRFILPLLLFAPLMVSGQGLGGGMGGESGRIEGRSKLMPLPYMNYDRSLGFTLGAIPLLMFNPSEKDSISPSSLGGAVGTWSTSKTWFVMDFGIFFLDQDNGRLLPGVGTGIRFRAFPENNFSVGMDVAAGIGDWGLYFQIGEAF